MDIFSWNLMQYLIIWQTPNADNKQDTLGLWLKLSLLSKNTHSYRRDTQI